MNQTEIIEGSRLIAEFEGRLFYGVHPISAYGGNTGNAFPDMRYHTSWDWLMPAVEKIENMGGFTVSIGFKDCLIQTGRRETITYTNNWETKIEGIFKAVVSFIKWYNQNHTTNE